MVGSVDNRRMADRLSRVTPSVYGHRTTTRDIVKKFNKDHAKLMDKLRAQPRQELPQWKQKRKFPRAETSPDQPRSPSPVFMAPNRKAHSRNMSFSSSTSPRTTPTNGLDAYHS